MGAEKLPPELLTRLEYIAGKVKESAEIRVISHYDADGISSAGIVCKALMREDIPFQATIIKSLDAGFISSLTKNPQEIIMFLDMGSGHLEELEKIEAEVIVLDHHKPPRDSDKVNHVNPHLFGIDGMTGASASAVSMLFAITMDERNWDMLPFAFAGIVGDRQHVRGLKGINLYLLENGTEKGIVEKRKGSLIPDGVLEEELVHRFDPFIVGVSGSRKGARNLLSSIGISPDSQGRELEERDRRKLGSMICLMLLEQGVEAQTLMTLTDDRYYFPSWDMEAKELSSLLNACGRTNNEGIGLALALGDIEALTKAQSLRLMYIDEILRALNSIVRKGLTPMNNIQYFWNKKLGFGGVLCGILMEYVADKNKPTVALTAKDDDIKISARATFRLLEKGIDLSEALRLSAEAVGGSGGGHAIASGASVPASRIDEFLHELDGIIGEQKKRPNGASSPPPDLS